MCNNIFNAPGTTAPNPKASALNFESNGEGSLVIAKGGKLQEEQEKLVMSNESATREVAFARIVGEKNSGLDGRVRKHRVVLGRAPHSETDAETQIIRIGSARTISRKHAEVYWSFERQRWEARVLSQRNTLRINQAPNSNDFQTLTHDDHPVPLHATHTVIECANVRIAWLMPQSPFGGVAGWQRQ